MKKLIATIIITLALATSAQAACVCGCVGNQKQWICSNQWDVPAGFCSGYCYGR